MSFKLAAISSLAALAAAAPAASSTSKVDQPAATTKPFVLSLAGQSEQYLNGLPLVAYHIGAGINAAVFERPSAYTGTPAYINGTAEQLATNTAYLDFILKGTDYPWGMALPATAASNIVEIVPGPQNRDFGVAPAYDIAAPGATLVHGHPGTFYACNTTFDGGLSYVLALEYLDISNVAPKAGCSIAELAVSPAPKDAF